MSEILKLNTIHEYNISVGVETLHPLVSVVDFSRLERLKHGRKNFGMYGVFFKEIKCGDLAYGRNTYDYQEGTLVFVAPGQVAGIDDGGETVHPKGWALLFHPDLIHGTSLGNKIRNYTFFSYKVNEALHMSERERSIILNCFREIQAELEHAIDTHSKSIIIANIEVMLNHCTRFYDRQFITREDIHKDILIRFEQVLADYFESSLPQTEGLPTVGYCAGQLHLSANYFGDLIKKETGKSAQEHIQFQLIGKAKEKLWESRLSIGEIAYALGFKYPHHLSRLFKKVTGTTPNEYRLQN